MKRLALLLIVALLTATAAGASEESRKLTARALYLLQSGFEEDALEAFEKAVSADESDLDARYYRGMLRGSRGDLATSISDLRAVLAARPQHQQAALELGIGLVQSGEFAQAVPWLELAQANPQYADKASLYLGLAQLRLQELDKAKSSFERVGPADPKLRQAARYYLGVVAYQQGRWPQAQQAFGEVAAEKTGSSFESEAAAFLLLIEQKDYARYRLHGALGFQYDTNVLLAPDDQALKQQAGVSNQEDGRFTLAAGGAYFSQLDPLRLSIGYDFYQSLHFDLQEFNLQDHRPSIELTASRGPLQIGLLGEYNFYLKETSSFLQEGTVLPWIALAAGDLGRTEFSYRMRRRDFLQEQFEVRDAFNHAFAARQIIFLGARERHLALGYRFDVDDPVRGGDSRRFAYFASEVNAGVGWQLPFALSAAASYAFRHETYKSASSIYVDQRHARRDNEHNILVALMRPLSETLSVTLGYSGTINNSNARAFKYDRHIASLALQARW